MRNWGWIAVLTIAAACAGACGRVGYDPQADAGQDSAALRCSGGEQCDLECPTGSGCDFTCSGSALCTATCTTDCTLACVGTAECILRCGVDEQSCVGPGCTLSCP